MGKFKSFEEINSWQKARIFNKRVYQITESDVFKKDYDFGPDSATYESFDNQGRRVIFVSLVKNKNDIFHTTLPSLILTILFA